MTPLLIKQSDWTYIIINYKLRLSVNAEDINHVLDKYIMIRLFCYRKQ